MQHYRVSPYRSSDKGVWDAFVLKSNQDTFLFFRDFMDYHSDRFNDFSLMIYANERELNHLLHNLRDVFICDNTELVRKFW